MTIVLLARWQPKASRTILIQAAFATFLAGCTAPAPISPTPKPPTIPAQTPPAPTSAPLPTQPPSRVGYLTFPYLAADAGNFALQAGETITLVWEAAPHGASRYEFVFRPDGPDPITLISTDEYPSDGAAAQWLVPEDLSGSFQATAYFPDGHTVESGASGAIYSGRRPPDGVCAMSTSGAGPIDLLAGPSTDAAPFAYLLPGSFAVVLRHSPGWYLVDASEARDQLTDLPAAGSAWVSETNLLKFHGPCDEFLGTDG